MSRNPEYQFVSTATDELLSLLIEGYERITGRTVHPADPERLFIDWAAAMIVQERVKANYIGNQNIPSRAEGENLDGLGELYPVQERPRATPSRTTMRMTISEPQPSAILVPAGTRVTDAGRTLYWETEENVYIRPGDSYVDVTAVCQTVGTSGNGYAIGQIDRLVDVFDYYLHCENLTISDGGSDDATDDEYYELMRASMDSYSTAGPLGGYIYHAKRVSTEIEDVVPNSPTPGVVNIYALMQDGTPATEEVKRAIYDACNAEEARPLTDYVSVCDPEQVPYNIRFIYYIPDDTTKSAADVQADVQAATDAFVAWQSGKLGRDINPSKLYQMLMDAGIKRLELQEPVFTVLRDGKLDLGRTYGPDKIELTVPQVAVAADVSITNGGYEDE